jgi:hypothetical protein
MTFRRVLATSRVSKHRVFAWIDTHVLPSEQTVLFLDDRGAFFAVLQSTVHQAWVSAHQSMLGGSGRYGIRECFDMFPFPPSFNELEEIGERYDRARQKIMLWNEAGLTATYNRYHDPDDRAPDMQQLRALQSLMDASVVAAYGWRNLALEHGFHETSAGVRFMIDAPVLDEIVQRLRDLYHVYVASSSAAPRLQSR